jgi:integrase
MDAQRIKGELKRVEPKSTHGVRTIKMPQICVKALRSHHRRQEEECRAAGDRWQETGYVFTSSIGTPLIYRNVLREFYKVLEAAHLSRVRMHDLRHSCASLRWPKASRQGCPGASCHSDIRLTKATYQHLYDESRTEAVRRMDNILGSMATKTATKARHSKTHAA